MKPFGAKFPFLTWALPLFCVFVAAQNLSASQFRGITPYAEELAHFLGIRETNPEIIQWNLTLQRDQKTHLPTRYELRCDYGSTTPNKPGLSASVRTRQKQGAWKTIKGTKLNPEATVHELDGGLILYELSSNVLHILTPERDFKVGDGGWSYTLNSTAHSEREVDLGLALTVPDMSYQIAPLATGPSVFGVFEGRTPAQGIARQLKIPVHAAATKAKWRVTLYHDQDTRAPTTYKIEGTLFRPSAREGSWRVIPGAPANPNSTIYELTSERKETLRLLKGDDNVLFFLDRSNRPLVGHAEFSYTLNRRAALPEISQLEPRK